MILCRINGKQYMVDFNKNEFYSVSTSRTFSFGGNATITDVKNCLAKYDALCVTHKQLKDIQEVNYVVYS